MGKDEVLTAGLADDSRVSLVLVQIRGYLLPDAHEYVGRSGVVDSGEIRVVEEGVGDRASRARDEIDNAIRDSSLSVLNLGHELMAHLLVQLHQNMTAKNSTMGRLPINDVTKESGRGNKITSDGSKVERGASVNKALERAIFRPVPNSRARDWLLLRHPIKCTPGVR